MRSLVLAIIFTANFIASLHAAPTVTTVSIDAITWSTGRITVAANGSTNVSTWIWRVRYGLTSSYDDSGTMGGGILSQGHTPNVASTSITNYQTTLSGLAASTLYHICPQASEDSGSTWSTCVDTTFTTTARGSSIPALPAAFDTTYPNTAGYTARPVASNCSDLQSQIDAAVTGQSVAGSVISIPAASGGTTCTANYTSATDPEAKSWTTGDVDTGTDRITITSHGYAANLPVWLAQDSSTLPGGLYAGQQYFIKSPTTNDFQLSLTSGGAAINLTSVGSAVNYIEPYTPSHSNWIVIRPDTTDVNFCPTNTLCLGSLWATKMAKFQITGGTWDQNTLAFRLGVFAHHFWFMGLEITHSDASSNLTGSTDPRPTYGLLNFDSLRSQSNIIIDRSYVHGLGYPNRLYRPILEWGGRSMAIVNSDNRYWDFFRPSISFGGLAPSFAGQTLTLTAGSVTMRASQPCSTSSSITFTRTAGTTSTGSLFYIAIDCTPTLLVPSGTTATCTGSMNDYLSANHSCSVLTSATPTTPPTDTFGGMATVPLATISVGGGVWTSAGYYTDAGLARSVYITEGTQGLISGWGPGPFKFANNWLSGIGNLIHFDDSSQGAMASGAYTPGNGYTIARNTFDAPTVNRNGSSDSNGLRYMQRNGIEWKNGYTTLIDGNIWQNFFADVTSTGCAVVVTPVGTGKSTDVTIRYNTVSNSICGLSGTGGASWPTGEGQALARVLMHDNIVTRSNGWTNYDTTGRASAVPFPFFPGLAVEDWQAVHNLVYDLRGANPQTTHWDVQPSAGAKYLNNIFFTAEDDGYWGFATSENTIYQVPACSGLATVKDRIDCMLISGTPNPDYAYMGNVHLPSYTNSQVPSGLASDSTMTTQYTGVGSLNWFVSGASVTARQANVGWRSTNPAVTLDYGLKANSAYCGGCGKTTDGVAAGPDVNAVRSAQGEVYNVRVSSITGSTATIRWTAPDSFGCPVDVGTNITPATGSWTRYDLTTSPAVQRNAIDITSGKQVRQSLALTGLSSLTTYQVRINCNVQQPITSFTTI